MNGVYCLISPNGKRYVGIGINSSGYGINDRWGSYKHLRCKDQPKIYNALKKYGPTNFKYEVILLTNDRERAKRLEKQLIALWFLQSDKHGYNISEGGDGWTFTKEQKENIKIKIKEFWDSERGDEMRVHMSENRKQWYKSESGQQHLKIMSEREITDETRKKLSDAKIGTKHTAETLEKLRNKVVSDETREILRKINTGKKMSDETKAKMSNRTKGNGNPRAVIRTVKNTITGEIYRGCLTDLARKLNQNPDSFRTTLVPRKRYKEFILLEDCNEFN